MQFWIKIFSKYPSRTTVIHDDLYPDLVVDVLDFDALSKKLGSSFSSRRSRDQFSDKYIRRYQKAVDRFRRHGKMARKYGQIEQRLFMVYKRNWASLSRLYRGDVKFRSQSGLADEFDRAIKRSDRFIRGMEDTFISYNLPRELTRMAFVESMFNLKARSKVGASGIWQFMPQTARNYLYVNPYIDERNSPLKATKAAAKLLSHNFQETKSWPLAITAYNHGLGGIKRAIRTVGTKDFGQIVRYYQTPSFGFASRNFYAEFLAAATVYRNLRRNTPINPAASHGTKLLSLNKRVSLFQLTQYTPLTKNLISSLNPCLLNRSFRNRFRLLPKNFELVIPKKLEKPVRVALSRIKAPKARIARR